jgi:NAD(P)H-dependent nitrite reductase large subunit/NAD(P)H-dependent nitrite reductase small subunit
MMSAWTSVCALDDILPRSGVCALVNGRQVAVFRIDDAVFAVDNIDPASGVSALSRGIVGDVKGEQVVASPLYKHHYSLATGRCVEDPGLSVDVHPVRVLDGRVWVRCEAALDQPGMSAQVSPAGPPLGEPRGTEPARPGRRKLVVVGNGMAGMRTVEELLRLTPDAYDITVFGTEPHGSYNRILLSPVLSGEQRVEDIILHGREWYAEHRIALHCGDPAIEIDRRRRLVRSRKGVEARYDRLLLATGSTPIVLPVPGSDLPGVVTFRDLADVEAMLAASRQYGKAAVIGGGLLGLEAAHALLRRGMDVTVVHLLPTLMERQLDAPAAALLKASLESRGLRFRMSARTVAVLGEGRAAGLRLGDGTEIPADLIVMAAGVRPNVELARRAGLRCERGVLVDDTLQTFDPSIYAVGECVEHRNSIFGLVAPLWEQARVCATHLAELGVSRFRGAQTAAQLKVTGIDIYSAGDFATGEDTESLVLRDDRQGIYKRLVVRNNRLCGTVLYGDTRHGPWYLQLMASGTDIAPLRNQLLFGPDTASADGSAAAVAG